jgi:hypothetical protein
MRERSSRPGRLYAAIPNEAMRDKRLSAEARGTLALLMTYSDEWTFRREHLMEVLAMGRDKFQRVMKELDDAGYVSLTPVRGDGGHLIGTTWIVHDEPTESLKIRSSAESLKNRQPVEPTAGKPGPIRRTISEEDQKERNTEGADDLFSANETPATVAPSIAEKGKKEEAFERFWRAFPPGRKTDKPKAAVIFGQIVAGKRKGIPKTDAAVIIAGVERYAATSPDPKFVPMPTTWLNGARWDDMPEPQSNYGGHRLRPTWDEVVR